MNLDMDSKILEIKNTSEVTKWTIDRAKNLEKDLIRT